MNRNCTRVDVDVTDQLSKFALTTASNISKKTAKRAMSNCKYKEESLFHCNSGLSITGESVQLLLLPSKDTKHLNTKHGQLVNERAIVLELYEEETKLGLSREESASIRWSHSAVKRLKAPSMTPYKLTKQVQEENALIFEGLVEQKKAN